MNITIGDWNYTIEVDSFSEGYPDHISGLPENSHPGEPNEIEYRVTALELDPGAVSFGGDIEGLINDWEKLTKLVIEAYKRGE